MLGTKPILKKASKPVTASSGVSSNTCIASIAGCPLSIATSPISVIRPGSGVSTGRVSGSNRKISSSTNVGIGTRGGLVTVVTVLATEVDDTDTVHGTLVIPSPDMATTAAPLSSGWRSGSLDVVPGSRVGMVANDILSAAVIGHVPSEVVGDPVMTAKSICMSVTTLVASAPVVTNSYSKKKESV